VPEKLTSNNKDEKRWWNYNALIFKCSCKVWTHFHKFVFYALFKSAAQFAILGRQKGLSRRRKGEGETRAYYRTYLIFHAQINAMKTHQLTRLAVNASVGIDTVWLDLHINCFWHRLFAELPSTYNSQILFFSVSPSPAMSSAYQPVGICPEKQLQSSQPRFFNCHNLRLNVLAFQLGACSC